MVIFPDSLLQQTLQMPGADHSFFKQICSPEGAAVRGWLQNQADQQPEALQQRAVEALTSLDNRRFFQGYAEIAALSALARTGWRPLRHEAPHLLVQHPEIGQARLAVLALLQQRRPGGEEELHRALSRSLSRVHARHRFAVLIRRWLPPALDPEPVRRALEVWLARVASGQWQGRYATYEDESISLEFSLTGEQVTGDQPPLAFCMGPFFAHRMMEAVEPRVVAELDRYVASPHRRQPLILACVTDQPWQLNDSYLLDFLYGRPDAISMDERGLIRTYSAGTGVCVFRDPLYPFVPAALFIDRDPAATPDLRVRACLNPWAATRLEPAHLAWRCFAPLPGGPPGQLAWQEGAGTRLGPMP